MVDNKLVRKAQGLAVMRAPSILFLSLCIYLNSFFTAMKAR